MKLSKLSSNGVMPPLKLGPNLGVRLSMKNIKTDSAIIARGMDSISANILNETYRVYPRSLTVKILAKNLKIREKSVLSALRKIRSYGVPVEIKINNYGEKEVKSSLKEPISWIEKEKSFCRKNARFSRGANSD